MAHHDHSDGSAPMPDDSPPRNGLIAMYTVLGVVTLFSLHFVFTSYFSISSEGLVYREQLSAPAVELDRMREDEAGRIERGRMPIQRAMEQLARGGRASAAIAPQPSDDLGPLEGWTLDSRPARANAARAAMEAARAAAAAAALDAGVAPEGSDAGVATPDTDAGARRIPLTPDASVARPRLGADGGAPVARPRPVEAPPAAPEGATN